MREYFDDPSLLPTDQPIEPDNTNVNEHHTDRAPSKWVKRNPDWYRADVRNNCSVGLVNFIEKFKSTISDNLRDNKHYVWNNLTNDQRKALSDLERDKSITVKPVDNGGALVIMNTKDYEEACLQQLNNPEFYQEIPEDRTSECRKAVNALATELHGSDYINEFEKDTLYEGERTSLFYGLPKIHKIFKIFPALRPICSGSDSQTVRLSEYVDTFLKPIAQKTQSYVRDTTDFINKPKTLQ